MTSGNIIDVNEIDFEYEVIAYSKNSPVLVDFWAEWCQPCKTLTPLLEKLVHESEGNLRLARVNVDQNPNLAMMFSVRTIPTVKAFTQGHVVAELVGNQPEVRLREFIQQITPPSAVDLEIEKGENLLTLEKWQEAETAFNLAMESKPESASALLGIVKALLAQGKAHKANSILSDFPASREYATAEILMPLMKSLLQFQENTLMQESDLDAAFTNSLRLVSTGKLQPALDGLLDLLRQDKHYRGRLAQETILGIVEIMGNNHPLTRQYRTELSSILFSKRSLFPI